MGGYFVLMMSFLWIAGGRQLGEAGSWRQRLRGGDGRAPTMGLAGTVAGAPVALFYDLCFIMNWFLCPSMLRLQSKLGTCYVA